ncbi:MSCRAMM family protein [Merdibacter massiliensis]|uniref:MSCRAMM family protein n=1 Tax=Merdibacter massiliensis TaxID=1871030 RepID=UPI001179B207|nr:SpaA isopeptide-forming pilin-related protein [Merdibacter massiliensis]
MKVRSLTNELRKMKKEVRMKRKYRKKISVIALVCLLFSTMLQIPTIHASSKVTCEKLFDTTIHFTSANGITGTWNKMGILSADGAIAFCVQPELIVNEEASYAAKKFTNAQKKEMEHIAYVGWVLSKQTEMDYVTAQFMIWELLGTTIHSTSLKDYEVKKKEIQNKIKQLYSALPSFQEQSAEMDVGETITLKDTNGVFQYYHLASDDQGLQLTKSGNTLRVTATKDAPEEVDLYYQLIPKEYTGTSMLYTSADSQNVVVLKQSDPRSFCLHLKINQYGTLKITKQDEDGTFVSNTSFKVSANSDMSDPIGTYTTGKDGTVTINDLPPATYYVQETAVPDHLVLDSAIHQVTVQANQTAAYTAQNNWKKGKVLIRKTDADSGKRVAGAVYAVYDANTNQEVARITTLANGYASSDYLRFGDYYVKEVIAPDSYILNDTKYPVTISENEQKIEITGVDERVRGTIRLEKQDSATGETAQGEATLVGAKYGLYARENIVDPADQSIIYHADELISELTINDQRKASISDLYLGKYYLKEIKASEGYTLDETEYDVVLDYQGQTTSTVTVNQIVKERVKAQAFQIIKVSDDGNGEADPLEGVEFTIKAQKDIDQYGSWEDAPIAKNAEGKEASILVTDEKGYAVSDELPYGTYVVRETKIPDEHYAVDDFTVVINEDNRQPQPWRIFDDERFQAAIQIIKVDAETGKTIKIKGAAFKIRNLSTNEYVGYWSWNPLPSYVTEWSTTEDGTVMTGDVLQAGEYQIEEIKAPNGYVLNPEPVKFKVSSNTAYETLPDGSTPVITVKMSDQPVKGQIQIEKRGEVLTGFADGRFLYEERGLEGMCAEVVAKEDIMDPSHDGTVLYPKGSVADTITTDQDGKGISKELPLGEYEIYEKSVPKGYIRNEEKINVSLTYQGQENSVVLSDSITLFNERQKVEAAAVKVDADTKEKLPGAEISLNTNQKIYNYDGEVILWPDQVIATMVTDKDGRAVFEIDLPLHLTYQEEEEEYIDQLDANGIHQVGNKNALWYIQEIKAPKGYISGTTTHYLFDTPYKENQNEMYTVQFELPNEKTKIQVSKTDITGEKELSGAHLQINDQNGQCVERWISDGQPYIMEGLHAGETYTLIETLAPEGYALSEKVTFVVEDKEEIQKVQMKDALTQVYIQKVDEKEDALSGNTLAVCNQDGKVIEEWTSGTKPHKIEGLTGGKTYILKELKAAEGYMLAKDMTFQVPEVQNEPLLITMQNQPLAKIIVEKIDAVHQTRIKDKDFEFTLYADANCTQVLQREHADVQTGNVTFSDLSYGTYYIKETKEPDGYLLSNEIKKIVVEGPDAKTGNVYTVTFENQPIIKRIKTGAKKETVFVYSGLGIISSLFIIMLCKRKREPK